MRFGGGLDPVIFPKQPVYPLPPGEIFESIVCIFHSSNCPIGPQGVELEQMIVKTAIAPPANTSANKFEDFFHVAKIKQNSQKASLSFGLRQRLPD